jgi:foldase protein PrsA
MAKPKILWSIIFALVLLNVAMLFYFTADPQPSVEAIGSEASAEIVARVGEDIITKDELVQRLIAHYGKHELDEMIYLKLVFAEAERLQLTVSETEVDREIYNLSLDYGSVEEFFSVLNEQIGLDEETLRQEIQYYILLEEMATMDIVIPEQDMRAYYNENISYFDMPTRFHLHRIILETEEKAEQVLKEIEEGSSFEAVAAEHSIDMITSRSGGDMGVVSSTDFFLSYEIVEAATAIELDKPSQPIYTEDGYVIIRVTAREEGGLLSFNEVQGKIRRDLALREINGIYNFLQQLRNATNVEAYLLNE